MALVVKDRVKENTATTGTGSVTLAGAVYGFQTFSSTLSDGDTTYYAIVDGITGDFEVGLGTYSTGVLSRDTILESSNSGSVVSLASGTKEVFITYPAEKSVYLDASDNVTLPGNLELSGTVDGRDIASDGAQIDSLGSAAFADTTDFASASHTHSFTTTDLSDIDNTARSDGSVLVYNGTTSKYVATNAIENDNIVIKGGNY